MIVGEDIEMAKQKEHQKRLEVLFLKHHKWLSQCAYNISKDIDVADDLVGQLYIYLAEKINPSLYYADSFNLMYARSFLSSRFLNKTKRDKKVIYCEEYDTNEEEEEVYDIGQDIEIDNAYDNVLRELNQLKSTKLWSSARIYELYVFGEYTLDGLAQELNLSKSTVFLAVKKIKGHLKKNINNPFTK
jgi:RNA polymerase sigma factor (sigma-70 family)